MENSSGVQYDEWKGGASADEADLTSISERLRIAGLVTDAQYVVGLIFDTSEYRGTGPVEPRIQALWVDARSYEEAKAYIEAMPPESRNIRKVEVPLTLEEFFRLFKRFRIALSRQGLYLIGKQFTSET